ncbi:glycosyltransferase [Candidatus Pelagibacter sp.]|nr:glycosyltransferase [Candidatus Pelagibacter sp.]
MSITGQNLSIVIVTLKSEDVIFKCLDSIDSKIPVFVIENSSNIEFKNILEKKYKNVNCTITKSNLGMGSGNNIGIKQAKSNYTLILNPDVVLKPNTIEQLILSSKESEDFTVLSPISIDIKYPNYKLFNNENLINENILLTKVKSVDGYAMLFNNKKVKEIIEKEPENNNQNYFDENFFMYLENDDLCKRIIENKGEIFVAPQAKIIHLGAKAVSEKYKNEIELSRNWHWIWSKFYFNKKHYGYIKALVDGLPNFIFSIFKSIFFKIIDDGNNYKKYLNRASGFYNALMGKPSWYRPKLKD